MPSRLRRLLGGIVIAGAVAAGIATLGSPTEPAASDAIGDRAVVEDITADAGTVELHRSATCSCCGDHRDYLIAAGFEVVDRVHESAELADVKRNLGVPDMLWSCHTSVIDGYAVEGHVPVDVIVELLMERPEIDGIALPGMPSGSPGMGGRKEDAFTFTAFTDLAEGSVFARR